MRARGAVAGDGAIFIALRAPDDRPTIEAILQSATPPADIDGSVLEADE